MSGHANGDLLADSSGYQRTGPPEHPGRPPTPWRQFALCRGADPGLWFPVEQDGGGEATTICWTCPVRTDCLTWAIEHNERKGIWGGISAKQRDQVRRGTRATGKVAVSIRSVQLPW
jgi:WhiB family redox-sensing transcriptional regulator